jgi:hypothetical protein
VPNFTHDSSQVPKQLRCLTGRRAIKTFLSVIALGLMTALSSCGRDDNIFHYSFRDPGTRPIKAVIRTTVPLAYAASVAMSSVTGSTPPNATIISNTCTTSPNDCAAVITINDDNSTVPLQLTSGSITVFGYWSSPTQAILTVTFSGDAGSALFPVHNVSIFPVSKHNNSLLIVYANIDINATVRNPATLTTAERNSAFLKLGTTASNEASANVNMDAWVITADDQSTPDVSDDTYSISGGGQYIDAGSGSASVLQLGMANVVMSACALNPNSGYALLNELESSSSSLVLATALFSFHPACDGNAKVAGAAGNYLLANGKSIPLNLNNP